MELLFLLELSWLSHLQCCKPSVKSFNLTKFSQRTTALTLDLNFLHQEYLPTYWETLLYLLLSYLKILVQLMKVLKLYTPLVQLSCLIHLKLQEFWSLMLDQEAPSLHFKLCGKQRELQDFIAALFPEQFNFCPPSLL